MTHRCDAVYEKGAFRPLAPLSSTLIEGQQVQIVVESETASADALTLLAQVYAGLSDEDIDAVEQIALDRSHFFTRSRPMIAPAILDTDTLSNLMRRHPTALTYAHPYLAVYGRFTLSLMTRYEILRGLKAKNAVVQQAAFAQFCATNQVIPLTDSVIARAADILPICISGAR